MSNDPDGLSSRRPCVVSLGINSPSPPDHPAVTSQAFDRGLARLRQSLEQHGYRGEVMIWDDEYPPGSPTAQEVFCAFKPYCMREAGLRGHDIVLWCDAAIAIERPIEPLLARVASDGYLLYEGFHSVGAYCKDGALETLGITREESFRMPSISAAVLGLDLSSDAGDEFLRRWLAYANDGTTFPGPKWSGVRGWPGTASADPRVQGHRHDQTAASVIALRLGMNRWRPQQEFSHWFHHDRKFVRTLGRFA